MADFFVILIAEQQGSGNGKIVFRYLQVIHKREESCHVQFLILIFYPSPIVFQVSNQKPTELFYSSWINDLDANDNEVNIISLDILKIC